MQAVKLKEIIINYLKQGWSPERIADRLKMVKHYMGLSQLAIECAVEALNPIKSIIGCCFLLPHADSTNKCNHLS